MRLDELKEGRISVDLAETEDKDKVTTLLRQIFPGAAVQREGNSLVGKADLSLFKEQLEKQKVRTTIESILDLNCSGDESFIDIDKLAASVGKIAVDESFPLGKIRLYVRWKKA